MRKVKKTNIVDEINQKIEHKLSNTKLLKYASIVLYITTGLIAIGYSAKIINFTLINLKAVASTIKE